MSPVCPHCQFNPSKECENVGSVLSQMDAQLESLLENWASIILRNLDGIDEVIKLLKPDESKLLEQFMESKKFTLPLPDNFVTVLAEILGGLVKVSVKRTELEEFLRSEGPATANELKERFSHYIDNITKGKDPSKIRIVVE